MLDTTSCAEYLADVRTFAEENGLGKELDETLAYLANYACHEAPKDTKCLLFKDFAPHSFEFVMQKLNKETGEYERWFNGGMIYHGPNSSGVEFPVLSVRIGDCSQAKWSIHT